MGNNSSGQFYSRMGLVLIAFLIAGFIPAIMRRFDNGGTMSLSLISHGVVYLSWFVLFTFQASLIAKRNIKLHKKIGKTSILIAFAMLITGILMMKDSFDRGSNGGTPFSPEHFIILPFMDLVLFTITFSLAYMNRKIADTHKHYMLLAGIMIMDPATARLGMTIGIMPLGILFHFGLWAAVAVFDKRTIGNIHLATKVGIILLLVRYAAVFIIGPTEVWSKFVHMMLG